MSRRPRSDEYEAAYATLLRAREEHAALLAYREFLERERARLDGFADETATAMDELPRALRRPVDGTTKGLLEAVGRRRNVVDDERRKVDDRIDAAQAFVEEQEAEVAALRQ